MKRQVKWTVIGALALGVGAAAFAAELAWACGSLVQQVVPSGAVMAFNLSACPAGWTALAAAGGRTIIGVNAAGGNGLSQRNLGDTNGQEQHKLTVAELPNMQPWLAMLYCQKN